jgi:proline dehydrogenase
MLSIAGSDTAKRFVTAAPGADRLVRRFVAGVTVEDAVAAVGKLVEAGLTATVDYLGEDVRDPAEAAAVRDAYLQLLRALHTAGVAQHVEVSVKASALGQMLPDGCTRALANARSVAAAAAEAGTTVTLDAEDHTHTEGTLELLRLLRVDYPDAGAVVQAQLRRTEADCRRLAVAGSRVRLCKGAYREAGNVAYRRRRDIDLAYVRCMKILLAGSGYPMLATHDPRLIAIGGALARRYGRRPGSYEFQMLYGVRPQEQLRLAQAGETVRVYVPFGDAWYGYLTRRMAERPANLAVFLRSLVHRS